METIRPQGAWLTTNRECNFRCKWCYAKGTDYQKQSYLSMYVAKNLLNLLGELNINNVILLGGEPTLWPHLLEVNRLMAEKKIKSTLVTNGYLFGDDTFWSKYQEAPNPQINISLKAASKKQLKQVAKVRNFKVLAKGIIRAAGNLENCSLSLTYNTFYQDNLVEMVRFATECGAKSVKIDFCSTTFSQNRPDGSYIVEPHQLVANILRDYNQLDDITNGKLTLEMSMPFCLWPEDFIRELKAKNQIISVCHLLKHKGLIFDIDGKLLMCNALFDYPIGRFGEDFATGVGLLNFLNQPRISSYYQRITAYPSKQCAQCNWYEECGGGCPLRWALYKPEQIIRAKGGEHHGTALGSAPCEQPAA